jgi:hypothetical protein
MTWAGSICYLKLTPDGAHTACIDASLVDEKISNGGSLIKMHHVRLYFSTALFWDIFLKER